MPAPPAPPARPAAPARPPAAVAPAQSLARLSAATRGMLQRGRGLTAVAGLAGLLAVAYGPVNIGYDPAWAIVWGRELIGRHRPAFTAPVAPTPHPLSNLVGALAALTGSHAYALMLALSFVAFASLGVAAFIAGRRSFGWGAGLLCAAILLTRPTLIAEALQASLDIPFLALVFGALAVELGDRRRPRLVVGLLAVAGLLRPEAWLLSAGYAIWMWRALPRREAITVALLAALAPVLWIGCDWVLTGQPMFSLTQTQVLASQLDRPIGLGSALTSLPSYLAILMGAAVVWCGMAGGVASTWLLYDRARLPALVLLAGFVMFVALGIAHVAILTRYLLLPGAMIALFAGGAVVGWQRLPTGSPSRRWAAAGGLVAAGALASSIPSTTIQVSAALAGGSARRQLQNDLSAITPAIKAGGWLERCGGISIPTYSVAPMLSYWLDASPFRIRVVLPEQVRRGLVLTSTPAAMANDAAFDPGSLSPAQALTLPHDFHILQRNRSWTLAERCSSTNQTGG